MNDAIWLVKSSKRILGPFSISEIENLLRTKEISITDEVIAPNSRWKVL